MAFKLDLQNIDHVTEDADGSLTVEGTTKVKVSARVAASVISYLAEQGLVIPLPQTPDAAFGRTIRNAALNMARYHVADDKPHLAAAIIDFNTELLPFLNLRVLPQGDLSGMPPIEGAGRAARAGADTIERFDAETRNSGVSAAELRQLGTTADTCAAARTGFQTLERAVGANQLKCLSAVRDQLGEVIQGLGSKAELHPQIALTLHDGLIYYNGAAESGQRNRAANKAWRAKAEGEIRKEVEAGAREQGRKEEASRIQDRIADTTNDTPKKDQ